MNTQKGPPFPVKFGTHITSEHFTTNPKPEDIKDFSYLCPIENVVALLVFVVNPFKNPVRYDMIIYINNNELFFAKRTQILEDGKRSIYSNSLDNVDLNTQMRQEFADVIKKIQFTYSLEINLQEKSKKQLQKI